MVTEVVDGQQRLLSLIGFFDTPYHNENGVIEHSSKANYALKDLRVLYKLNDSCINHRKGKKILEEVYKNKILNYELTVLSIDDNGNKSFSAVEHFIRLNKNASVIKDNTYRMWSLMRDLRLINYEKDITAKYIDVILPPKNQKRSANMITWKLFSLFYHQRNKELKQNDYSNVKVTNILKDFNETKEELMFKAPDKIKVVRKEFLDILDEVAVFYENIVSFLEKQQKDIRDLFELKKYANIPLLYYYYLFVMFNNLTKEDIIYHSDDIYRLVHEFFEKISGGEIKSDEINELLSFCKQKIIIYRASWV